MPSRQLLYDRGWPVLPSETRTQHFLERKSAALDAMNVKWQSASSSGMRKGSDSKELVRFEVFTVATMKNGVFWDVTPCGSCN
jgi:hypothetical protein